MILKIQQSISEYTKAYAKEAEILSDNYRKFETRASATMKSEISSQTKQELKNITESYRKAQADYNRTATKLNQYQGERMSTAEALRMKERADKQRAIQPIPPAAPTVLKLPWPCPVTLYS